MDVYLSIVADGVPELIVSRFSIIINIVIDWTPQLVFFGADFADFAGSLGGFVFLLDGEARFVISEVVVLFFGGVVVWLDWDVVGVNFVDLFFGWYFVGLQACDFAFEILYG